jgi:hypothetical protein
MKMMEPSIPSRLQEMVRETIYALTFLDAARLQVLAQSCRILTRDLASRDDEDLRLAREAAEARADIRTLARVLEGTKANLQVLYQLRNPGDGSLGYGPGSLPGV